MCCRLPQRQDSGIFGKQKSKHDLTSWHWSHRLEPSSWVQEKARMPNRPQKSPSYQMSSSPKSPCRRQNWQIHLSILCICQLQSRHPRCDINCRSVMPHFLSFMDVRALRKIPHWSQVFWDSKLSLSLWSRCDSNYIDQNKDHPHRTCVIIEAVCNSPHLLWRERISFCESWCASSSAFFSTIHHQSHAFILILPLAV